MNILKNKNLNRQKILLSPGAGNLRGSRVENNDRSVDEFDSGIQESSVKQNERNDSTVSGEKLIV
jgi:hypothetical protein